MEHIIKINLTGGIVSAGDLYEILLIAETAGAKYIRFGNRQQLYFSADDEAMEHLEMDMLRAGTGYEVDTDEYPNIISSYVCDSIFSTESWLSEGVYRDIFDSFTYRPQLKINIVDQQQTFVPFFSGNINFISSAISNYWHLYIRFPKTSQFYHWPVLVYSDDIARMSKAVEDVILKDTDGFSDQLKINELFFYKSVTSKIPTHSGHKAEKLILPDFYLPYYEGFNKYSNNKYWLGIYRRNELFPIDFLKDAASLCINTRVGQLYATPWKSILIKDIDSAGRTEWGSLLNKYRLNVRHAANELNWQTEDLCAEGLQLKQQLVRDFEEADLRTYRLSFAIKTQPKTGLLGSVIIKKQSPGLFNILHTPDFNPNNKNYILYKNDVKEAALSFYLAKLCEYYYSLTEKHHSPAASKKAEHAETRFRSVYQCKNCLSIYDEQYGDLVNGIAPATRFEVIESYVCPVCEAPKQDFVQITITVSEKFF